MGQNASSTPAMASSSQRPPDSVSYAEVPPPYKRNSVDAPEAPESPDPRDRAKRSNHVSVIRDRGILKGIWIIDPLLTIPSRLLPPLRQDEEEISRKNLYLHAKSGGIDVELQAATQASSRTSTASSPSVPIWSNLEIRSGKGDIVVKLHAGDRNTRLPISLEVSAANGSIVLYLSRSLQGPVNITSTVVPTVSKELSRNFTTISEVGRVRKCFVGDLSPREDDADELTVEALVDSGRVHLQYVDEPLEKLEGGCVVT